jgi:hypothetical protein
MPSRSSRPSSAIVTVKLPRPIANRLRSLARRTGKGQSELIREGLALRMDAEGGAAAGSVLEVAGDLVGALAGPLDLATHPRHMRGFGR